MTAAEYLAAQSIPLLFGVPAWFVLRRPISRYTLPFAIIWVLAAAFDVGNAHVFHLYQPDPQFLSSAFLSLPVEEWVFIASFPFRVLACLALGDAIMKR